VSRPGPARRPADGAAPGERAAVVLAGAAAETLGPWGATLGRERQERLLSARLLDVLAGLAGLAGVAISVVVLDGTEGERLRSVLPEGTALEAVPDTLPVGVTAAVAGAMERRLAGGAGRVIVVRETALPLPPWTVLAAFEALADSDLVVGPTSSGGIYLLGARDGRGVTCLGSLAEPSMAALARAAVEDGLTLHHLEPRRTVASARGLDSLAADVERLGELTAHLRRWLGQEAAPPGS